MKTIPKMKRTHKNDDLTNQEDHKNEDDPKKEDDYDKMFIRHLHSLYPNNPWVF